MKLAAFFVLWAERGKENDMKRQLIAELDRSQLETVI